MRKKKNYESQVEEHLLPLMGEHGFELVGVGYVKEADTWYLRAYIDKEDGIAVNGYEAISRVLGSWLDKEDSIDDSYILEVSSPGLGHPLKREEGFIRSMGKGADVRLYRQLNKQKEFTDALSAYNENTVTPTIEDGSQMALGKADIALTRLVLGFQLGHSHAEAWIGG